MRNLVIIAVAIIFGLTSCQKESLEVVKDTNNIEVETSRDNFIPQKPLNDIGIKSEIETNGIPANGQLFTTQISTPRDLMNLSNARNTDIIAEWPLSCGDTKLDHNKLIFDSSDSKKNNYNSNDYHNQGCLNYSSGFDGRDVQYPLWIDNAGTYTIQLSQMSKDLDVFLYSLDAQGNIDQCLGYGLKGGVQNELINADLDLGVYAIIVDAYVATDESDFKLEITCSVLLDGACEWFDDKNIGAITPNVSNWIKYNNNTGDAYVTTTKIISGGHALLCDDDTDVVYQLGKEYNDFTVFLSWEIYVPKGKSAAFAFEKNTQPGLEHSLRVFMGSDNSIAVSTKGQSFNSPYTYRQDQWVSIEVEYNLSGGRSKIMVDGHHVANFSAQLKTSGTGTGQNKLAGINFWTQAAGGEFYLDDICYSAHNPLINFLSGESGTLEL